MSAEKAIEICEALVESAIYIDSYGVPDSDFRACRLCECSNGPGLFSRSDWHSLDCPAKQAEDYLSGRALPPDVKDGEPVAIGTRTELSKSDLVVQLQSIAIMELRHCASAARCVNDAADMLAAVSNATEEGAIPKDHCSLFVHYSKECAQQGQCLYPLPVDNNAVADGQDLVTALANSLGYAIGDTPAFVAVRDKLRTQSTELERLRKALEEAEDVIRTVAEATGYGTDHSVACREYFDAQLRGRKIQPAVKAEEG